MSGSFITLNKISYKCHSSKFFHAGVAILFWRLGVFRDKQDKLGFSLECHVDLARYRRYDATYYANLV